MQIAALFLMLFVLLCRPAFAACPDVSRGESTQDCPWAELARTWSTVSLKRSAPTLYRELQKDSKLSVLKTLWGESSNFDELAKARIVDPEILQQLAKVMKAPAPKTVNGDTISLAGLAHTYGYLFSTLKTAFGFKRARWVSGEIEEGLGLKKGLFGPDAPAAGGGTLFSNVTYFFGRIAFRDNEERLTELERGSSGVASAIREFDYASLKPIRLEEIIPSERTLIHTDLIPFPKDPTHELLVYSIVHGETAQMITGFPITQEFADTLLDPDGLGDDRPIMTRYNAYLAGISGKKFTGTRRIVTVEYVDRRKHHVRARH